MTAFSLLGTEVSGDTLKIVLPVGISFYTFQTLSYTIDVYRRQMKPTRDFVAFSAFVSFFPQLVAGPIERASNLLPQFLRKRTFDYGLAVDGMRQILWGLFKKVVIADGCAVFVNQIYGSWEEQPGSMLVIGTIFFALQIYADFSGYSDIAIGTSRLFGFNLMRNFAFPYFSRDIAEFWRRWHISLSTWFRDYVYIPLGGSRVGRWGQVRNTFIIFLVSGFWHGANWTFIMWGALNAFYFLPLLLTSRNRRNIDIVAEGSLFPEFQQYVQILTTFGLTTFGWIFFRAESVGQAFGIIKSIFSPSLLTGSDILLNPDLHHLLVFLTAFTVVEWLGRSEQFALARLGFKWPRILRLGMYLLLAFTIGTQNFQKQDFIYFQF